MNFWVGDPHWGWLIVAYFFLGGIAAGSYFLATLIEWFGSAEDRPLAQIAYWLAFPLVTVCGILLIVDLSRPERFWHMLFKSEVVKAMMAEGFPLSAASWRLCLQSPIFKYWSPMSVGSWGLTVFGACSFVSCLQLLRPHGRISRSLERSWIRVVFQVIGCMAGFFVASYTGILLSATNQPLWSDTNWLASLFLASAVSTSLATLTLIAHWKGSASATARNRLAGAEPLALGLELFVMIGFLASLGTQLGVMLLTWRGIILVLGVTSIGILCPLLLHARISHRTSWGIPTAAGMILLGGLLLRYTIVTIPIELLNRGPDVPGKFSPEDGRRRGGGLGADVGNYVGNGVQPESKMRLPE